MGDSMSRTFDADSFADPTAELSDWRMRGRTNRGNFLLRVRKDAKDITADACIAKN
jgi:hypothetical protein